MTPTIVRVLMSSPSSCALHTASLTLVTSLHCVYMPRKDYVAMGEDSWQPWPPQLLMGPDKALLPVTGLHHCDHPQLASTAACHLSKSLTMLHHHARRPRPNRQCSMCQQPRPPNYLGSSRCLSWPQQLCVCLQLAPTTTQAYKAGPHSQMCAHHQLWPPPLDLEAQLRNLIALIITIDAQ